MAHVSPLYSALYSTLISSSLYIERIYSHFNPLLSILSFLFIIICIFFFSINTVPPIVLLLLHPQRVLFSIHAQYFMTHKALINTNLLPMESDEYYYSFFFLFLVHSFVFFFFFLLLRVKRLFLGLFVDGGRH